MRSEFGHWTWHDARTSTTPTAREAHAPAAQAITGGTDHAGPITHPSMIHARDASPTRDKTGGRTERPTDRPTGTESGERPCGGRGVASPASFLFFSFRFALIKPRTVPWRLTGAATDHGDRGSESRTLSRCGVGQTNGTEPDQTARVRTKASGRAPAPFRPRSRRDRTGCLWPCAALALPYICPRHPAGAPKANDQSRAHTTGTSQSRARARARGFVPFELRRRPGDRAAEEGRDGPPGLSWLLVCRDELQDDGRGGGCLRGVVVRVLGRRGGPLPGQRGRPPAVRAAAGAAEADELGQHLRHVRHDGAPPRQEGAVDVLPGQVAVVRVHGGGEVPGGPAEEGEAARAAQDEALQELRRAGTGSGRDGQKHEAGGLLLRQPRPHGRRQRLHGAPELPRRRQLLPSVGWVRCFRRLIRSLQMLFFFFLSFRGSSVCLQAH